MFPFIMPNHAYRQPVLTAELEAFATWLLYHVSVGIYFSWWLALAPSFDLLFGAKLCMKMEFGK